MEQVEDGSDALAERVGESLTSSGATVAVAESLTGGLLVQALAKTEGSGDWLAGGVVAYATEVKRRLLDVSASKVVSAQAAREMATGVRTRLGADVAVAVTGVAGPDEQDGEPPGTVWIGIDDATTCVAEPFQAEGSPTDICDATVVESLRRLLETLAKETTAQ